MKSTRLGTATPAMVGVVTALAITLLGILNAQAPAGGSGGRGGGRGRGGFAPALFTALDANKDGALTRDEIKSTFDAWFTSWDTGKTGSLTQDQLVAGLGAIFPPPPVSIAGAASVTGNSQPLTARQADIDAMMAALPTTPGVKPLRPRKVLVLAYTGPSGFVHTSIPIAAKTVEALGNQGNLWSTTVTYNAADINAAVLKQYDLISWTTLPAVFSTTRTRQ